MSQQHQVAITNDRSQDIVKVMRDATCKLANGFHLGLLRDLAFQCNFFAIILQPEQHRSLT